MLMGSYFLFHSSNAGCLLLDPATCKNNNNNDDFPVPGFAMRFHHKHPRGEGRRGRDLADSPVTHILRSELARRTKRRS